MDTLSIEEYRNHLFTEKEEWNNSYNPKRCSIEALIKIEVKQKGNGPIKKIYVNTTNTNEPGPYYDPTCLHLHIWKNAKLIKNFECEQNQSVPYIEYTNFKTGLFCCICHTKNNNTTFKWNAVYDKYEETQEIFVNRNPYLQKDCIPDAEVFPVIKISPEKFEEPISRVLSNWTRMMCKFKYSINFSKIIYTISNYESLYLWPWELTNYKKLVLKEPNYKKSVIFIKDLSRNFRTEYSYISE
jgi:hypothetical protein